MTKSNFVPKLSRSTAGRVAYCLLKGILGSILILLFLSGFMSIGEAVRFLPWIVGFNAALSCFTLMQRGVDDIGNKRITAAGAGAVIALLSGLIINTLSHYVVGMPVIYWFDMMLCVFIGSTGGFLGAQLALAHQKLDIK